MQNKTLLLTLEYPPQKGGIAIYLEKIVKDFKKDKIIILTSKYVNSYTYDLNQDYKIIRKNLLGNFVWPKWKKTYDISKKLIKKLNIDHIIISQVLPMGYVALLLDTPYTVILHGLDLNLAKSKPIKKIFLKIILNKSEKIIVNSNYTKSELMKVDDYSNKTFVQYPIAKKMNTDIIHEDIVKIKQKYCLNNYFTLLSVNRLVSRKGNDVTIQALAKLKNNQNIEFQYLIIGNGPYQSKLENLIKKYKLDNSIKILNNVQDKDLSIFYSFADLFIMPARIENHLDYEGFGIVYMEADQFNLPIIAGNTGGVPEAIEKVKKGVLVDPVNIDEIANEIKKIYERKN